ncbi:peptide-methionine (S)-S-oxide reductase [Extibacter muris]|uniref:peptide-methionine (S)-S-oxide reductase n=1 Tax=Extibacter muris TaxID=1796622 RepID=UPI001D061A2E|nr:peptide-methionine (S)-S-oxide reductase [Extibacter muris]MCB6203096.1 peptide-methionine (S)-S-oxide reductase [Extibacter muris]MCQ4664319.1 peptide-methionine (S)-S-oxide reductase [Extibacter muris]MCQ4692343.1 peptide-methionine (S)-S-oxide reductase [Extibacter muris]MCQ4692412.1 peptide-methionine (S)-S-oxide reductase [Extibacter muris]
MEAYVKRLPGVSSTEVVYDTSRISTDMLLDGFFKVVDPISVNRQGNDRGSQYRSGIYYVDEASKWLLSY